MGEGYIDAEHNLGSFSKKKGGWLPGRQAAAAHMSFILLLPDPLLLGILFIALLRRPFALCLSVQRRATVGWDLSRGVWANVSELLKKLLIRVASSRILN